MTAPRTRASLAAAPGRVRSTLTGTRGKTPYGERFGGVAHNPGFCYNPATSGVNHE